MGLITKNWGASTFTRGASAHDQFLATGFNDAEQARSACPVQPGDGYPLDTRLIAKMPDVSTPDSPQNFVLDVDYAPSTATGDAIPDELLLKTPPNYYPDFQDKDESIDRDVFGTPITNSAGDPPSKDVTETFSVITYTYERYEAEYDGAKALAYSNKTNSDAFEMPGFGRVDPGQAKCKTIRTDKKFNRDARALLIIYSFEIREDGFKKRLIDKGRRGWSDDQGAFIDDIYLANGKQVTEDVLLNGQGIPKDSDNYVIGEGKANPIPHGIYVVEKVEKEETDLAVFLKYQTLKSMPFSGLNLEE